MADIRSLSCFVPAYHARSRMGGNENGCSWMDGSLDQCFKSVLLEGMNRKISIQRVLKTLRRFFLHELEIPRREKGVFFYEKVSNFIHASIGILARKHHD